VALAIGLTDGSTVGWHAARHDALGRVPRPLADKPAWWALCAIAVKASCRGGRGIIAAREV